MMVTERNKEMLNRVDGLNKLLGEGDKPFKIIVKNNFRNNGSEVGYMLYSEKYNVSPTVYFEHMESFWESSTEVVSYLEDVFYRNGLHYANLRKVMNKDYILSNVKPKLVSQDNIADIKAGNITYHRYLDMLIIFDVEIVELSDNAGVANCTLQNEVLFQSGINDSELFKHAIANMEREYQIVEIREILREIMDFSEYLETDITDESYCPMWIITNWRNVNGASGILSKKILSELSEKFEDGEFVILPSSIHECIAISARNTEPGELRRMVQEVNSTVLKETEILTDNVYIYRNNELSIY